MIIIAPKSSITANAVKNILSEVGTRFPNNDNIPNAKAMSVAIGIPAPDCVAVPKLNSKKNPAGINIPPNAPKIGNKASFMFESSP